jgi:molybdopterin/thiamine biosynthesis adenylyltransferase
MSHRAQLYSANTLQRSAAWSYDKAFSHNRGLISSLEQQRLRHSRVAIAGLGGVGGADLVALARLGIGKFTIADPDVFEMDNTNRQYGATRATEGHLKAEVMRDIVLNINPEAQIRLFCEPIGPENAFSFMAGADIFVDAIDASEIKLRRVLYRMAQQNGIFALGAGPFGFSTGWSVFDPLGMTFDRYYDLYDHMPAAEELAAFLAGAVPSFKHRPNADLPFLDTDSRTAPSVGFACQLASGAVAAEVLKILLRRGRIYPIPYFHQFDAYRGRYVRKRLWGGNRHPLQRLKRRRLLKLMQANHEMP